MSKLKIAFLGATRALNICKNAGLFQHDDAEVAAVCDFYPASLDRFREGAEKEGARGVRYLTNSDDLLALDADAIVLCNYATEHAPWAIRAMQAGKHVLSESLPMQALSEAVELTETVEKTGLVYNYSENYCFFEPVLEMRRLYEQGEIGDLMAAEAVFVNDLSKNWPRLTRGNPESWRNHAPSTFYCTHSIGPMLYATGRRAVRVIGMEIPTHETLRDMGARAGSAATELMQLDNGGMAKAMHGNLKRDYSLQYSLYCKNGTMETDKLTPDTLHVCRQLDWEKCRRFGHYDRESYKPLPFAQRNDLPRELGLSCYYIMESFLGSIRGREECKKYAIDVYQAMDMSLPGFLAYRSILAGNQPMAVPDFRDPAQREEYRFDTACTDPKVAGDKLLPTRYGEKELPPEAAYERCRSMLERGETDFW